jgi:hypothetical protein
VEASLVYSSSARQSGGIARRLRRCLACVVISIASRLSLNARSGVSSSELSSTVLRRLLLGRGNALLMLTLPWAF